MTPAEASLIEQAAGAFRGRDPFGRIQEHPAFADLDAAGREAAYELAIELRRLEAAFDEEGLSTTGRQVLMRVRARRT